MNDATERLARQQYLDYAKKIAKRAKAAKEYTDILALILESDNDGRP